MSRIDISTVDDPRIAVFVGLRDHVARQARERPGGDRAGSFIVEGDLVIDRAIAAGHRLESVLVDARRSKALPARIDAATPIYAAAPEVLSAITGRAELRDPLACFTRPPLPDLESLLDGARTVAVLEGVNNPNNLGVIMRNAAALGLDAVLLDPTSGDPLYRRAVRASMGQVFALPHTRTPALADTLGALGRAGFTSIALSPTGDRALVELPWPDRVAILLGAEGPGLQADTLAAADIVARIDMARRVDSLNVGSAAAIAFHHAATMRNTDPDRLIT